MAYKIKMKSFTVTTETDKEALTILLSVLGLNMSSFGSYMGMSDEDIILTNNDGIQTVAIWAINYLKDLLNIELIHLGYQAKDIKAQGLFADYDNIVTRITEMLTNGTSVGSQPITINKDAILTEAGAINAKYLVRSVDVLNDFI